MKKQIFLVVVSLIVLFMVLNQMTGTVTGGITWRNVLLVIFIPVFFYNAFGLIERIRRPAKQN